jgi:hypothetical protein
MPINPSLITTAIDSLPAIIALFRSNHAESHPGAPIPTSEEVIAALHADAIRDILADEAWKAAHDGR